jgi:hypothetical protein
METKQKKSFSDFSSMSLKRIPKSIRCEGVIPSLWCPVQMCPSVSSARKEAVGHSFEASSPDKMSCHSYSQSLLLSFFPEAQKCIVFLQAHEYNRLLRQK